MLLEETEMGQEKAAVGLLDNPNLQNQAEKETKEVRKVESERKKEEGKAFNLKERTKAEVASLLVFSMFPALVEITRGAQWWSG